MMTTDPLGAEGAAARWRFPAEVASVPLARRAVREYAEASGASPEVVDDVALCVTEAATNAVLHAFLAREAGTLTISARPGAGELVVRVSDDGAGMTPRTDSPGLGLGLPTIGRLTLKLDILEGPDGTGTEVAMVFAAPGVRGVRPEVSSAFRYEILAEVAHVVSGDGWPRTGVDRLADALVPALADACALDVLDERGVPGRLAARVDSADPADSAWLAAVRPRHDAEGSAMRESLGQRRPRWVELTPEHMERVAPSRNDIERVAALGLRWWLVVPLVAGEQVLGALHLGQRAARGPFEDESLALVEEIAERAAGALATDRLATDLRRARERFERVLDALDVAVAVQDHEGRILFANDAAARVAGVPTGRDVVESRPGELIVPWSLAREDGTPLTIEDTPGRQAARGLEPDPLVIVMTHRETGETRRVRVRAERLGDENLSVTVSEILSG